MLGAKIYMYIYIYIILLIRFARMDFSEQHHVEGEDWDVRCYGK